MAIKFAGVSDADAVKLAVHFRASAERIRNLPRATFAAYVSEWIR